MPAGQRQESNALPAGDSGSLARSITETAVALRELGAAWLDLIGTEARAAGHTASTMVALAVAVAVVGVAAWLFLTGAAVVALVRAGMPVELTLILTAVVHGIVAFGLVVIIRRLSRRLTFPATRDAIQHETRSQT